MQSGPFDSAAEQTTRSAGHRTIGADYKNCFFVCAVRRTASLSQVPPSIFSWFVSNCSRVINRTFNHYEVRAFGDVDNVSCTDLNVCRSICPFPDVFSYMNDQTTRWRRLLQLLQR